MEELIKVFVDNGISVGCVVYLMYFNITTMKDYNKILDQISQTLTEIKTTLLLQNGRIEKLESKIN